MKFDTGESLKEFEKIKKSSQTLSKVEIDKTIVCRCTGVFEVYLRPRTGDEQGWRNKIFAINTDMMRFNDHIAKVKIYIDNTEGIDMDEVELIAEALTEYRKEVLPVEILTPEIIQAKLNALKRD